MTFLSRWRFGFRGLIGLSDLHGPIISVQPGGSRRIRADRPRFIIGGRSRVPEQSGACPAAFNPGAAGT